MNNGTKLFKNPGRNQKMEHKPYVPQYVQKGLEPTPTHTSEVKQKVESNPRSRFSNLVPSSPIPQTQIEENPMPNIGNNIENIWTAIDGEDIYMDEEFPRELVTSQDYTQELNVSQDYEYLILINQTIVSSGSKQQIENEVQSLIYGEHSLCEGEAINPEEITVLKKVPIKIGIFIE